MIPIHFQARWDKNRQQMAVSLQYQPEQHFAHISRRSLEATAHTEAQIEWFSKEEWAEYIADLDKGPLRLGGYVLNLKGSRQMADEFYLAAKAYLRRVDEVFRKTGQTEIFGEFP